MWEARYSQTTDYLFGKAPAQFLCDNPGWISPGQDVLSVADGEGRNAVHIARQGARVRMFDLSPTAVERAHDLAAESGVMIDAQVSSWQTWDWGARAYDLVVAMFIQYAGPEERHGQFMDIKQSVKPGGVVMLHGYRPEQIALGTGGPPSAKNMYTMELLAESFGDWHVERLASYERDVQEGRGHSGKSALIDLIARKPV